MADLSVSARLGIIFPVRIYIYLKVNVTFDYIFFFPSSDVDVDKPDEKSVMTYVAQFLKYHPQRKQRDAQGQQQEEVTSCQNCVSSLHISLSPHKKKVLSKCMKWSHGMCKLHSFCSFYIKISTSG